MSTRLICIINLLLTGMVAWDGHSQSKEYFTLPANTHTAELNWRDSLYRFPNFEHGRITFKTGFSPEKTMRLNYNLYLSQLEMINEKNDTVQLKPSKEIKLIEIGTHLFYYHASQGYIEILAQLPVSLGVSNILKREMGDVTKNKLHPLWDLDTRSRPSAYDRYYRKTTTYFFIDQNDKVYKAIKSSILKLFPHEKERIGEYIEEKHLNFNREHDLVQLLIFCHELKNQPLKSDSSQFFTVKAGINILKDWYDSVYRFPMFQKAKITLKDATITDEPAMNYNRFTGEMDIVDNNGDTVAIKNSLNIGTISIGDHMFCYDYYQGYIEVLLHSNVSLGVKNVLALATSKGKTVDTPSDSHNGQDERFYSSIGHTFDLDKTYTKETTYFLIDNKRMYPASKAHLMRLFSNNEATIRGYINQNAIDMAKERDLKELLNFCNELRSNKK